MDLSKNSAGRSATKPQGKGASVPENYLVICDLDDSQSCLAAEAAFIDRWFGIDILALFGERS